MIRGNEVEYWSALGNVARVRQAIVAGYDVNAKGEMGYTALHAAAENGHMDVIRMLIDHGAKAGVCLDSGESAYELAVLAGNAAAAELLRQLGG